MNRWARFSLCCLLLIAVERTTYRATNGFRLSKTSRAYPYIATFEIKGQPLRPAVLNQPFTFLGSGVQFYAFLGEDRQTVLKLFKHHHFGLETPSLAKLPFADKWIKHRRERMLSIFQSAYIARTELEEETGVFFLQINPADHPTITLYDKIGIKHTADLSTTPFLLQRFASPLSKDDDLDGFLHGLKEKNIAFTDPHIRRNFGKIEDRVILYDIGSFIKVAK